MDLLEDLLYNIGVIHANAGISIKIFLKMNIATMVFFSAMTYVFVKRMIIAETLTVRPIQRVSSAAPYHPPVDYNKPNYKDIVKSTLTKEKSKLLFYYIFIIASFITAVLLTTRAVLYFGTLMWLVGGLSVYFLKGNREEMARTIENHSLIYCWSLLLIKFFIAGLLDVPSTEWSRTWTVSLPPGAASSVLGYLPWMFITMAVGIPFNYCRVVFQRWSIVRDNDYIPKRQAEIMRTGNQNNFYDETKFRY